MSHATSNQLKYPTFAQASEEMMKSAINVDSQGTDTDAKISQDQFSALMKEISRISSDIEFIKDFVQAKQEKGKMRKEKRSDENIWLWNLNYKKNKTDRRIQNWCKF